MEYNKRNTFLQKLSRKKGSERGYINEILGQNRSNFIIKERFRESGTG